MSDLYVRRLPSTDPRLGRHVVHDPRSRSYAATAPVDKTAWRTITVRVYDPIPNPNQVLGDCTGCAKAMQLNTIRNRVAGQVLDLEDADRIYALATTLDPFDGAWPPDDTGSSGLAAAKAAAQLGLAGPYRWRFDGADGIVAEIQAGRTMNVGAKWTEGMFNRDARGRIEPTGPDAGGHEWLARGYDLVHDEVIGRCWWGTWRDFRIKREHLNDLVMDDGDAHWQERAAA